MSAFRSSCGFPAWRRLMAKLAGGYARTSVPWGVTAASRSSGQQSGLNDGEQDSILSPVAKSTQRSIVDAIYRDAHFLCRDRSWRVINGANQNGVNIGDVAAIGEGKLRRHVGGNEREQGIHQFCRSKLGLKAGFHLILPGLITRIRSLLRGGVE